MRARIGKPWKPIVGGVVVAALVAWFGRRGGRRRPNGPELTRMTDSDFADFIQSTGIKTVSTPGLAMTSDLAT